jgi:hypothetical protein
MAVTHLADITDRIDRSFSPWGGREERELDDLSKEQCGQTRIKIRCLDNASGRLLLPAATSNKADS